MFLLSYLLLVQDAISPHSLLNKLSKSPCKTRFSPELSATASLILFLFLSLFSLFFLATLIETLLKSRGEKEKKILSSHCSLIFFFLFLQSVHTFFFFFSLFFLLLHFPFSFSILFSLSLLFFHSSLLKVVLVKT